MATSIHAVSPASILGTAVAGSAGASARAVQEVAAKTKMVAATTDTRFKARSSGDVQLGGESIGRMEQSVCRQGCADFSYHKLLYNKD